MTTESPTINYRFATPDDVGSIAALHSDSWRRHYRGVYADDYLDGPVFEERTTVWRKRLAEPDAGDRTVLAEVGDDLVGFVHVVFDADPDWGALVDNLHVRADQQRRGLGRELMARAAHIIVAKRPRSPMYLWVLDQNVRAQAFYRAIGGREVDRKDATPPGGGSITGIRYVWSDPSSLTSKSRS